MINILIADNQLLTREGTAAVLSGITDINVVGQVSSRREIDEIISIQQPDVILIDHLNFEDISLLARQFNPAHIVILSNKETRNEIQEIINLGIKNYVSKACSKQELILAVYAAAKGKQFFCEQILQILFGNRITGKGIEETPALSSRETEIVHLVTEGLTNKEIAERLFLSIHTVKTHRKNIIKKLGFSFKNAAELMQFTSNNQ